jgi:hypothetical protein
MVMNGVTPLVSFLSNTGWTLNNYCEVDAISFRRVLPHSQYGHVRFSMYIYASGDGSFSDMIFESCKLIGPKLDFESGKIVQDAVLQEWDLLWNARRESLLVMQDAFEKLYINKGCRNGSVV